MNTSIMVHVCNIRLTKFDKNYKTIDQMALVFTNECIYGVILGANFLTKIGIDTKYSTEENKWY